MNAPSKTANSHPMSREMSNLELIDLLLLIADLGLASHRSTPMQIDPGFRRYQPRCTYIEGSSAWARDLQPLEVMGTHTSVSAHD